MAVFYTQKDGCLENKILLGVNGGLCLLMSVVSISPSVRDRKQFFFLPYFLVHIINVFDPNFGNYGQFLFYHRWVSIEKVGFQCPLRSLHWAEDDSQSCLCQRFEYNEVNE